MARMIDEMLVQGYKYTSRQVADLDKKYRADLQKYFMGEFDRAVTFCVDNVTEYLYAQVSKEDWDWKTDFPNIAPPFEVFWMETHKPSIIRSDKHGEISTASYPPRWGCLFRALEVESTINDFKAGKVMDEAILGTLDIVDVLYRNEIRAVAQSQVQTGFTSPSGDAIVGFTSKKTPDVEVFTLASLKTIYDNPRLKEQIREVQFEPMTGGVHWLMRATVFIELTRGIYGPMLEVVLPVSSEGQILDMPKVGMSGFASTALPKDVLDNGGTDIFPFLLALSFLNCRNVETKTIAPPEKVSKNFRRTHGRGMVEYKVLDIIPLRKVSSRRGDGQATGNKISAHIVRGHFKTYTADKPLLGRHVGTWFWHDQVRGSVDEGIIDKEYNVKEPV